MTRTPRTTRTPNRRATRASARRSAGGFNLLEVLVSLGIFAVGLVAVAAVFPTAITIQRETVRELDGRRVAQNAKATIVAQSLNQVDSASTDKDKPYAEFSFNYSRTGAHTGSLLEYIDNPIGPNIYDTHPVQAMIDLPWMSNLDAETPAGAVILDAPTSFHGMFTLDTRSYPKNIARADRRDYYWYPLLQVKDPNSDNPQWFVHLLVMHRSGTQLPPQVRRSLDITDWQTSPTGGSTKLVFGTGLFNNLGTATYNDVLPAGAPDGLPDFIQPGDKVLADNGQVLTVVLADNNSITVNSPNVGRPGSIYFAVAIDSSTNLIKPGVRSPIVFIEESIPISVRN